MNRAPGGWRKPGQNPSSPQAPWVGGKALDARRGKERAKSAEECAGDARSLEGMLGAYLERSSLGAALLPVTPRFLEAWERAAGEGLAKRARPVRVENGVLELSVDDPTWKFELRFREAALLEALAREGLRIKAIRTR